ncbi:unnamed protein product [Gongylonema pulchrum]|uniref:Reverse transcriptase n=1 Tax=Gongylonema pulchrum TaxID=637853 RepID=A0A183D6Y5_9BILA|nr:unnamed protein product [Gongylonema pulchrum]
MDPAWSNAKGPFMMENERKRILVVTVQIFKTDGHAWKELTEYSVPLQVYQDMKDGQTKLAAYDGDNAIFEGILFASQLHIRCQAKSIRKDLRRSAANNTLP